MIPVVGAGAEPFVGVRKEDLRADLDYKIVVGSTRSDSHQQKAAEALADIQVVSTEVGMKVSNVPKAYEEYWVARGKNPREYVTPQETMPPQQPGQDPPKGGNIDPAAMQLLRGGGQQ
jgi:hypothetical protein